MCLDHQGGAGEGWQLPTAVGETIPRLEDQVPAAHQDRPQEPTSQVLVQEAAYILHVRTLL